MMGQNPTSTSPSWYRLYYWRSGLDTILVSLPLRPSRDTTRSRRSRICVGISSVSSDVMKTARQKLCRVALIRVLPEVFYHHQVTRAAPLNVQYRTLIWGNSEPHADTVLGIGLSHLQ